MQESLINENSLAPGARFGSLIFALAVGFSTFEAGAIRELKPTGDSGVELQLKLTQGDESGNEIKSLKTELLIISSEKKALSQLLRLEKKYAGSRMEPEVAFRLAEIYMRRARSERFFEIHRNSEKILMFAPEMVKSASEAAEIRKAVLQYLKIEEKHPRFATLDIVYFNHAYAHQQLGEDKKAEVLFSKLISLKPDSPLVPDCYLSIGEINFKARNYGVALANFQMIKKFPTARVYPYGLYKTAWSHYNLQDAPSAMRSLEEVIEFGRVVAAQKLDSKLDLRKEALSDLALFFSEVNKSADSVAGAVDYFRLQAKDIDPTPYLLRLSEIYKRHSRYSDVETLLTDLIKKIPESASISLAHEELIWNFERTKKPSRAVTQLSRFSEYCESIEKKTEVVKQPSACRKQILETSKKLAAKWHAIWKKFGESKEGSVELVESSEQAYRLYMKMSNDADGEKPTMSFALAELLFARKKYREASEWYESVARPYSLQVAKPAGKNAVPVTAKKTAQDEKLLHDASYAAVLSLEKAVDDKWNAVDEKKFVDLSELYIALNPKGLYVLDLRFKRGLIAYEKERFDEAAPIFKSLGWTTTKAQEAGNTKIAKAQDLYLDILNHRKDFKGIREASHELLARGQEPSRTVQMEKVYREAYFAEIQTLEERGDLLGAVAAYKSFALENSGSELAPKAWWNASQLQFRMGDPLGGANTCYQMFKLFPKSENGRACLQKSATTFESIGRIDLAAHVLLNLALVDVEKQDKWRELSADFFALTGSKARAVGMYSKLLEGKDKTRRQEKLALLEKSLHLLKDIQKEPKGAESKIEVSRQDLETQIIELGVEPQASRMSLEHAEAALEQKEFTRAFAMAKKIIAKDSLPKNILARARFLQAKILEDEYRKQSVKAKVDRIGMVLALKTEKLEKAQKALQSTIAYGDAAIAVQALQHLAECYLDYSRTVRSINLPASVSSEERSAFQAEIQKMTLPMEEKGVETLTQALETAKKAQLLNGEIANLQIEVAKQNLKPIEAPVLKIAGPGIYLPRFQDSKEAAQ